MRRASPSSTCAASPSRLPARRGPPSTRSRTCRSRVAPGEIVCVVGESGSGKSVIAHAVMGLLPPASCTVAGGSRLLDGDDLLAQAPTELRELRGTRMAMIFQEPMTALNPVMRCGDQIDEVLRHAHRARASASAARRVLDIDATRCTCPSPSA